MTVTITGNVQDVTGVADNETPWLFASVIRFADDGAVITDKIREARAVGGVLKVELEPGYAIVTYGKNIWEVTVPETPTTLKALIEAAVVIPPGTNADMLTAMFDSYLADNPIADTVADYVDTNVAPQLSAIITPIVIDEIAADGTVVDAAAAAVTADIAGRDMLEGSDPRVPELGDLDAFRVLDNQNRAAIEVTPTGTTKIGPTEIEHGDHEGLRIYDTEERIAFEIRSDGKVFIGDLADDSAGSSAPGTVHVLIGMGQSNMSGRGLPISAEMDPAHPRIFQYGANASEITTATVPLDMVDAAYGISPLTLIAREYLQRLPDDDVILLIPAARGGSVLGSDTSTSSSGVWNVAYAGASVDLYALALTQIDAALAAAVAQWPTASRRFVGMFWHQGEANATTTSESDYAARFDAIVADLRSHVGDSDMPVVLGGIVPEWAAITSGAENIVAAHVDTPNRLVRTGYAYPPDNGGGNFGLDPSDRVHFNREALEELSARMLLAWDRALRNTSSSVPRPPAVVSATVNNTLLTVQWSQPMCRYTAFTPEFSYDGSTWTPITHTSVDTTATATITQVPVLVRVSTTNDIGTSAPSTPVYATVIKEP